MQKDNGAYLSHQQMAMTMWTHPWSWAASMGVGNSWTVVCSSHYSHTSALLPANHRISQYVSKALLMFPAPCKIYQVQNLYTVQEFQMTRQCTISGINYFPHSLYNLHFLYITFHYSTPSYYRYHYSTIAPMDYWLTTFYFNHPCVQPIINSDTFIVDTPPILRILCLTFS